MAGEAGAVSPQQQRSVVAGVIVALFGGFLLAGVLTQPPSDPSVPAVGVSASASAELADTVASSEFSLRITGYPWGDRDPQNPLVDTDTGLPQDAFLDPDTGLRTVTGMSFEARDPDVSRDWSTVGPPIIGPEGVDPRALGSVTEVWAESPEVISAEWRNGLMVERRSTRVENDGGVWVGTATLPSIGFGVEKGTAMWELVGEDGYEGLTMFLWGEYKHHPDVLVGIIVPSDSVPDFPPPPAAAGTEQPPPAGSSEIWDPTPWTSVAADGLYVITPEAVAAIEQQVRDDLCRRH